MTFTLDNRVNLELINLDKTALIKQTHEMVKQEKMYTMILLQHLQEIEKRGLHLELGFSHLHNFLVVEFKYSDTVAATRLQAMRCLKAHQLIKEKMAEGTISLSQAADINRFLKAEIISVCKEDRGAAFSPTQERSISIEKILKEVEGEDTRESKKPLDKMRSTPQAKKYSIDIDEKARQLLQEMKKIKITWCSRWRFY